MLFMHKAALAVNVAILIERLSLWATPRPPQTPIARLRYAPAKVGLVLEQPLYATKPPQVKIIAQDAYFLEVERLLHETSHAN
jgi:hypothetical protein